MSLEKAPLEFSTQTAVESLSSDELEYISEFSDQIESLRFLSRNFMAGPVPTLAQAIEIVDAAPAALRSKQKSDDVVTVDEAWHDELGAEFLLQKQREGHRLPAVLSRKEVQAFLDVTRPKMRDHLIMRVFYASGIRISELEKMLIADLYLDELKIFIRDGKGDKDRYVLIDPETARLLAEFTQGRPLTETVIGIGDRQISRIVEKYAEQLGIPARYEAIGRRFTPHCFRHTYATHLYEAGLDLYVLKDLLGHDSIGVTTEYIYLGINKQRAKYQAFHPFCQPDGHSSSALPGTKGATGSGTLGCL